MERLKIYKPRCSICGQFLALALGEGKPGESVAEYTPCHEVQGIDYPEKIVFTHKRCLRGED